MSNQLTDEIRQFLEYLAVERNCSPQTISSYSLDLGQWSGHFLEKFGDMSVEHITLANLKAWPYHLYQERLKIASILRKLSSVRSFFRYLHRRNRISTNMAIHLPSPKKERKLPRFLFESEIQELLAKPVSEDFFDLRDYLILDVLYATGLRVSELVGLKIGHFASSTRQLVVMGKGSKERVVFISRVTESWLAKYLAIRRTMSVKTDALFLSQRHQALSVRGVQYLLNEYFNKVGSFKQISPHVLRHTFATHLMNSGADVRSVQELLGHASLATTQIYTQISKLKMKEQLLNCHPRGV